VGLEHTMPSSWRATSWIKKNSNADLMKITKDDLKKEQA